MDMQRKLFFAVSDRFGGLDVAPDSVPLDLLHGFAKDVSEFIRGDGGRGSAPSDLLVSVVSGSLAFESRDGFSSDLRIWRDIEQLSKGSLDGVDRRRAKIAEKWRGDAMKRPTRAFRFGDRLGGGLVLINERTFFSRSEESNWVLVERYLSGVVEDFGGVTAPNIHLRMADGSSLKIDATREQIRMQDRNPVYHEVVMRVELEEDFVSGGRRNARFLGFSSYDPKVDEDQIGAAVKAGAEAWKDVGDSVAWVRMIRGGGQ